MILSAKAFAKVNIGLDITGTRDDGYHLIDTIMQSVSLFDTVTIEKSDSISVICGNELSGEKNICYKAAKRFFETAKVNGGVKITVEKEIPLAAGMGGGSADAAAVLLLLNKMYDNVLSKKQLEDIALSLGADVPFCLYGGTMRAQGIGEVLTEVENNLSYYLVLVKNGIKPSTAQMYAELDLLLNGGLAHPDTQKTIKALKTADYDCFINNCDNIFSALWDNNDLCNKLIALGADTACLSGSGPTVFGIFSDLKNAKEAFEALRQEYNQVYLAQPMDCSIQLV